MEQVVAQELRALLVLAELLVQAVNLAQVELLVLRAQVELLAQVVQLVQVEHQVFQE